jgi:tetratricopeptide (TPR) repeat protein
MRRLSAALVLVGCCAAWHQGLAEAQDPASEDSARRHYLSGLASLREGQYPDALKDFQAVLDARSAFPGSDVVPAAMYHAGEALRLVRLDGEAIVRYRQVTIDFPGSAWAAQALIAEARCLVATGRPQHAMERLQRVRERFPRTPEASRAIALNTVLYRLYLRAPAQPPFQLASRSLVGAGGRLKDIEALVVDGDGQILAAAPAAVLVFDPSGKPLRSIRAIEPRSVSMDAGGRPLISHKGGLLAGGTNLLLSLTRPDGSPRPLKEVVAAAATPTGDLLVADRGAKAIARFSPAGQFLGPFAAVNARRLAVDATGLTAALEQDAGAIVIFEPDGTPRTRLASGGPGHQFERPVDLAFDPFGHLYVLDRNRGAVVIFRLQPQPEVVATFAVPQGSPGNFRKATAFALDAAGRLFVYDEDAESIQVYQ